MNKIKTKLLTITFSLITILALGLVNTTSINNLSQTQQPTQFNENNCERYPGWDNTEERTWEDIEQSSIPMVETAEVVEVGSHLARINFTLGDAYDENKNYVMTVIDPNSSEKCKKVIYKEGVTKEGFISIPLLDSNTEFVFVLQIHGAEVHKRSKEIEVTTQPIASKIEYVNVTKGPETNSVKIHFKVTKEDGGGDVVIKDDLDREIASKNNVNGDGSIVIKHLEPGIIYPNWTMTLDGSNVIDKISNFNSLGAIPIHPDSPTSPSTPIWLVIIITIASTLGATIGGFAIYSTIKKQK